MHDDYVEITLQRWRRSRRHLIVVEKKTTFDLFSFRFSRLFVVFVVVVVLVVDDKKIKRIKRRQKQQQQQQ